LAPIAAEALLRRQSNVVFRECGDAGQVKAARPLWAYDYRQKPSLPANCCEMENGQIKSNWT
jgi:hypothetical protein